MILTRVEITTVLFFECILVPALRLELQRQFCQHQGCAREYIVLCYMYDPCVTTILWFTVYHRNFESLSRLTKHVFFGNSAILEDEARSGNSSNTHLIFFLPQRQSFDRLWHYERTDSLQKLTNYLVHIRGRTIVVGS